MNFCIITDKAPKPHQAISHFIKTPNSFRIIQVQDILETPELPFVAAGLVRFGCFKLGADRSETPEGNIGQSVSVWVSFFFIIGRDPRFPEGSLHAPGFGSPWTPARRAASPAGGLAANPLPVQSSPRAAAIRSLKMSVSGLWVFLNLSR